MDWGETHQDYQRPILLFFLVCIGVILTVLLIASYWLTFDWAVDMQERMMTQWKCGCLLAPIFVVIWMIGLVLCGTPAIILVLVALFA